MTIIYIAGPISGLPDGNKPAFDHAQDMLTKAGHIVMSPHSLPFGMPESSYMDICLAMVRACERVVLLKGWENSLGVAAEQALAHKLGKAVSIIHFENITDPSDLVELVRVDGDFLDRVRAMLTEFSACSPVTVAGTADVAQVDVPCPSDNDLIDVHGSGPETIELRRGG